MSTEAAITPDDVELGPRDWMFLTIPGLIWGSSFFLIAEGLESFSPYLLTSMRILFGCVALAAVPAARRPVPESAWKWIATLGVLWMAVPLSLFSLAQERVSSSLTGMVNGGTPLLAALVAALMARRSPPGRQLVGLAIGLTGIALTALPSWAEGGSSAVGVALILLAISCYGVAINVAGHAQRRYGSLPVIVRALAIAAVLTAPLGVFGWSESSWSWSSAIAVVVLGAGGTGIAFVVAASNSGRYGGTRASSTTYLIPVVALFLGVVFRGETVEWVALLGCAVALVGAYLVNARRAPQPSTDELVTDPTTGSGREPGSSPRLS